MKANTKKWFLRNFREKLSEETLLKNSNKSTTCSKFGQEKKNILYK